MKKIITSRHMQFRITALAVVFVLLVGVTWPATHTYADDAPVSDAPPAQSEEAIDAPVQPDTVVDTGDASSVANAENDINTSTFTTPDALSPDPVASTTSDTAASTDESFHDEAGSITIDAENVASTTNTTSADATTGDNAASGEDGNALVNTGDAYASANAVNLINTNVVDSSGLIEFSDFFMALGIDLRSLDLAYFTASTTATSTCSFDACAGGNLFVTSDNTATTTNIVSAFASTGDNVASSTGASATIMTGDAYASANAVNVINTNIVKSKYLLIGINNFGTLTGDFVLPGAAFFEQLLARSGGISGVTITSNNSADVTNADSASAETGGNTATTTSGSATILTGDALSSATTLNQVNTNFVGGTSISILFRIWGNLTGAIHGLPAGLSWRQTPEGILITNVGDSSGGSDIGRLVSASSTNKAWLMNSVDARAQTGNNIANGLGGAAIMTGNAYAAANSVNIVNTNLIGTNWIEAIFNVFGDLDGNIAFGHPDLWLGATAQTPSPTLPGANVTFTFTVANRGDADANHVQLSPEFLPDMLDFDDDVSWDLGTIRVGETEEFTYDARTGAVAAGGSVTVPVSITATSDETDNNPSDNTDDLTIVVTNPRIRHTGETVRHSSTAEPELSIVKIADAMATTAPATVNYTIDITNTGGPAYEVLATDTLTDPAGEVISTQSWDLDTVFNGDEIKITYSVVFDSESEPGEYTNTVTVTGKRGASADAVLIETLTATRGLTIRPSSQELVCEQYLTSYIRPGGTNDEEQVRKLQTFLRDSESENGVTVTGTYDKATIAALKRFQQKYGDEILAPWGYNTPTGFVYYTTQKKINDVWCTGRRSFALTQDQIDEIRSTRQLLLSRPVSSPSTNADGSATSTVPAQEIALPPGIEVGVAPAPNIDGGKAPPAKRSWFSRLLDTQRSLMANVLDAFSAIEDIIALK